MNLLPMCKAGVMIVYNIRNFVLQDVINRFVYQSVQINIRQKNGKNIYLQSQVNRESSSK